MLRGYRIAFCATLGLILIAASPPKDASSEKQDNTQQSIANALNGINASLQKMDEPSQHDKPCAQGEDDRSSDLCAQWKAADASNSSAIWTERTFWLVLAGTLIGLLTLGAAIAAAFFAKKAADHTETGANATIAGNNQTIVSAERQDRAYLAVEPGGVNRTKSDRAVGDIVIRNIGRIPANNVKTFVRIKSIKSKNVGKLGWPKEGVESDRTIQPGGEMRRSSTGTTAIKNIDDPKAYVYVWGVIEYEDGFGNPRYTRFCHRYPGAWTTRRERPRTNLGRMQDYMTVMIESQYADELIPARFARHHHEYNDAD